MSEAKTAPASRNDPCPCGSGKRYKHCHGVIAPSQLTEYNATNNRENDVYAILNRALAAQQANDLETAEQLYREGLKVEPSNFDALHMLGVVLMSQGKTPQAIDLLERAHAIHPDDAAALHNLSLAIENRRIELQLPSSFAAIETASSWQAQANDPVIAPEDVRLIAYYLPQFHCIPENDAWWGKGFTEWVNVARARPNYDGHYQPHLPGELGAYDLLADPTIASRQAALAREHGLHGFAYYHYWFRGKRLLEQPLERVLRSKQPDFPFCVFWANEPWSRRWDGGNQEVLMPQMHDAADDLAFIEHLLPYFSDHRYIRVRGRPLLMVYRVELFPNAKATAQLWHDVCRANGFPPPYLVKADTGASDPPERYGFDASVEFPPHRLRKVKATTSTITGLDPSYTGHTFDIREVISQLANVEERRHRHFQCIAPAWDNTARKQRDGMMFVGERLELFRAWARNAMARSQKVHPQGEQLVFVNAWNEWAEGAHLEPCRKFGRGWLEALRDARSIPECYQPISQLTDANLLRELSTVRDRLHTGDELTMLASAWRRQGNVERALEALGEACKQTTVATPALLREVADTIELLESTLHTEKFEAVSATRRARARQRSSVGAPLVSILIPSYGHALYVSQAIQSALDQTYPHIEVIIIDDGSKDDSVAKINEVVAGTKRAVRFIARENRGANTTINEAAALARGVYINVLNSDDQFTPDRIEQCVAAIHYGGAVWGYARTEFIDDRAQPLPTMDPRARPLHEAIELASQAKRQSEIHVKHRCNPAISTGNLFVDRTFFSSLGGYTNLRYVHDWDFCLRAMLFEEPVWLDKTLYRYRFHGKNTIFENELAAARESDQTLVSYYENADSPANPLAWSRRSDGAKFLAHRALASGPTLDAVRELAVVFDSYRTKQR